MKLSDQFSRPNQEKGMENEENVREIVSIPYKTFRRSILKRILRVLLSPWAAYFFSSLFDWGGGGGLIERGAYFIRRGMRRSAYFEPCTSEGVCKKNNLVVTVVTLKNRQSMTTCA